LGLALFGVLAPLMMIAGCGFLAFVGTRVAPEGDVGLAEEADEADHEFPDDRGEYEPSFQENFHWGDPLDGEANVAWPEQRRSGGPVLSPPEPNWVEIARLSNESATQAPVFRTPHNRWRIRWTTAPGAHGSGEFGVDLHRPDGTLEEKVVQTVGEDSGKSYYFEEGSFQLRIEASQPYVIAVEAFDRSD
jgi:hypothetical protein